MLSEIYILRLEAMLRASNAPAPGGNAPRFVPIKLPTSRHGSAASRQIRRAQLSKAGVRLASILNKATWIKPA
jgi:hypothetical protein